MIGLLLSVLIKINGMDFKPSSTVRTSILKLCFYPIIFIICWVFSSIQQFSDQSTNGTAKRNFISSLISLSSVSLPILQGFFNAIAFFYLNDIVKNRWYNLYCELFHIESKNTSRGDSIVRHLSIIEEESYINHNENEADDTDDNSSVSSSFMNIIQRFSTFSRGSSTSSIDNNYNIEMNQSFSSNKGIVSFNNPAALSSPGRLNSHIASSPTSNFKNNMNVKR